MPSNASCGPILIVEDDDAAAELVALVLVSASFEVHVVARGDEAVEAARGVRPRLAVVDVNLPGLSGYEVCRRLRQLYGRSVAILFVSGDAVESYDRVAGLLIGGDDFLVKPFAPDELLARVQALLRRPWLAAPSADLTTREQEVLALLAEGLDQREIAERLVISAKTVGSHIEHILSKLGVRSRAQAVAIAYRDELVSLPA